MTPATVNCYAGSSYPERPRSFDVEGQHFEIKEILHRRREPNGIGFVVCCQNGALFDLFYQTHAQTWQIHPKGCIIKETYPQEKTADIQGE